MTGEMKHTEACTCAEALVVRRVRRDGAALPDQRELGLAGRAEPQDHPHAPPLHRYQRRCGCAGQVQGVSGVDFILTINKPFHMNQFY